MDAVLNTVLVRVMDEMNKGFTDLFKDEEVNKALFQMYPTKAPGPYGYPAHFFQKHWELCGTEVMNVVLRILCEEESPEVINETILVLISKDKDPINLTQFWPISLCNVLYKIASKVLSNRLKQILPEIISKEQYAFVPDWLITDNIITAYEFLTFMKRNKAQQNTKDMNSDYKNSGVMIECMTDANDGTTERLYGRVEEI